MKILLTGAHFTPAQAVIEELFKFRESENQRSGESEKKLKIVYIGRKHTIEGDKSLSVESQVLPKLGVKFLPITAGRIKRDISFWTVVALLKIPVGFLQAFRYLLAEKPDLVVSFGGYVGVPVVISAWLLNIPILIHEQTLVSGMANSISGIFASKIAVTYKNNEFKKEKTIVTGNPLRLEVLNPDEKELSNEFKHFLSRKKDKPLILVTGGNQGSHILNSTIEQILPELTEKYLVVHQTGDSRFKDFERLETKLAELKNPENYLIKRWINAADWGNLLNEVDLVISRAGANTLAELAFKGIPTLVIPIPYLYKNEQVKNARFFENIGLCKIIYQEELTPGKLSHQISECIKNLVAMKKTALKAKDVIIPDAAKRLAQEIVLLRS